MTASQGTNGNYSSDQWRVKVGLAGNAKGRRHHGRHQCGAGAHRRGRRSLAPSWRSKRVPSDIRKEGGVARMAAPKIIREIMNTVSIPVMAKVRIGHFAESGGALRALEVALYRRKKRKC